MAGIEALPPKGARDTLYVVDLYGSLWRFFKVPGGQRWAARQFTDMLKKLLRERDPARLAVATDNPWPTWRHEDAPTEWKVKRVPLPAAEKAALLEQVRHAQEALEDVFGVRCFSVRGFDGDDVVASLVEAGLRAGLRTVVLGYDKDFAQLVEASSGRRSVVWDGKQFVTDKDAVRQKFKVWPWQMVDYQALVGDSGDGVPGVRGVGPGSAVPLLERFETLEVALEAAERFPAHDFWVKRPALRRFMAGGRKDAERCRRLVTLRRDVPLGLGSVDELRVEDALP